MSISSFNVNPVDIASANLGWLVAQMLLGTLVTKKIIEAKDAQDILNFCRQRYIQGHKPVKLDSFVKTTGGKGLHVVVPLKPKASWEVAKNFCQALAESMAHDAPENYVSVMTKSRRKGRIFVDYLRNGRGATAVAAYSTRAREGAPVSTPLTWEELSTGIRANHYTVENLRQRLDFVKRDPWEGFFGARQTLSFVTK